MVRRGSTSSLGSASGDGRGQADAGLRRQNSTGLMTERTFRSPSPNRSGPVVRAADIIPPMPPLPRYVPAVPQRTEKRSTSLEAPIRMTSPLPKKPGGRGASVDATRRGISAADERTYSSVSQRDSKPGNNQRAINFSYPISPPSSPAPSTPTPSSPVRIGHSGWHSAPYVGDGEARTSPPKRNSKANMLPPEVILATKQSVQSAADRPVSKKDKKKAAQFVEGSHLASGGARAKPSGTSIGPSGLRVNTVGATDDANVGLDNTAAYSPASTSSTSSDRPRSYQARAAGLLAKQPSVVREEREREEQEDRNTAQIPKKGLETSRWAASEYGTAGAEADEEQIQSPTRPKSYQHGSVVPSKASDEDLPNGAGNGSRRGDRPQSLSPTRYAHFSTLPVSDADGVKHQPPWRALSPAKSALKHSPASSIRTNSPISSFSGGPGRAAPSEISDTISDDGNRLAARKKKNVRVSFERDTLNDGTSEDTLKSPESPVTSSQQTSWSARRPSIDFADEYLEEIMTPSPALPSFGSIRGRRRRDEDEAIAEKVTETVNSSLANSYSTIGDNSQGASSDRAVGAVLARDFASKNEGLSPHDIEETRQPTVGSSPLPPEVTSVEGSGYVSDSGSSTYVPEDTAGIQNMPHPPRDKDSERDETPRAMKPSIPQESTGIESHEVKIPSIALVPPTPGEKRESEASLVLPGSFPSASEPGVSPIPATTSQSPPVGDVGDSDDESGNSIYSDAAEDPSDLIDREFGSLNTIVSSPVGPAKVESPTTIDPIGDSVARGPRVVALENRGVNKEIVGSSQPETVQAQPQVDPQDTIVEAILPLKRESQVPNRPRAANPLVLQQASQDQRPVAAAKERNTVSQASKPSQVDHRERQSDQSVVSALRQSKHAPKDPKVDRTHIPKTLRSSQNAGPSSDRRLNDQPQNTKGTLQKRHIPMGTAPVASAIRPPVAPPAIPKTKPSAVPMLTRRFSGGNDSSDSESSFKRRRPRSSAGDGRVAMRRTMRGGDRVPALVSQRPTSPPTNVTKPGRFSLRSRPSSELIGGPTMKHTMRGSADFSGASSKRRSSTMSPSRFSGFGRSAKGKTSAKRESRGFKSRFADSSDEDDEPAPRVFRSRFADSDDEEDVPFPAGLTPVRGIPRRSGQQSGDSTDLEDSEDEDKVMPLPSPIRSHKSSPLAPNKNIPEGSVIAANSLTPNRSGLEASKYATAPDDVANKDKKRHSFFGLRGKKKDSAVIATPDSPHLVNPVAPFETHRRTFSLASMSTTSERPRSPKLQRRNTPDLTRITSDSWPLPSPPASEGRISRPGTSGSAGALGTGVMRPRFRKRHTTGQLTDVAETEEKPTVVSGRTGKKKKFPKLRKAFGLTD